MVESRVDQCMNAPNGGLGSELQNILVWCIRKHHDCAELYKRSCLLHCATTS